MRATWLPTTTSGRMFGDYVAVPWSRGRPVLVYSLAAPPRAGTFRQAIAAVRVP
jgi:endonuclease/exonuclease/phosphatase (EEP) superfamily protein YafD